MAAVPPVCDFGWKAVGFSLPATDGKTYALAGIAGKKGTLIAFICNHCPYVKAIIERLCIDFKALQDIGVGCAAIMPNDTDKYPADSFENMITFAKEHHFTFPYLIDETQRIAKAYDAVCTPDIFGFDKDAQLVYRGRLDSAGPNEADENTVQELFLSMKALAKGQPLDIKQYPSMGCSIKWK